MLGERISGIVNISGGVPIVSHVFDPTLNNSLDPDSGFANPLNDGYLGLGSVESARPSRTVVESGACRQPAAAAHAESGK